MAELQCAAYRAIPRKRTVLSTGFAVRGGFGEYVDTFIRHGGGRCYDAVSVHLYGDGRMLDSRVRAIERFRRDEVWVTETGASSVPGKVSELPPGGSQPGCTTASEPCPTCARSCSTP